MRRPFIVGVLAALLPVVMWGYGAFISFYSAGGWWGMMGPNMMAGVGTRAANAVPEIVPIDAREWFGGNGSGMEHGMERSRLQVRKSLNLEDT